MNITVKIKNVYGERRVYPACDTSKLLMALSPNLQTFGERQIDAIKQLGYTIHVQAERL
jgi:hypothetical protein